MEQKKKSKKNKNKKTVVIQRLAGQDGRKGIKPMLQEQKQERRKSV